MSDDVILAADLERQIAHWRAAAKTFLDAEEFASEAAWRSVESQVGLPLRRQLAAAVRELLRLGIDVTALVRAARTDATAMRRAHAGVQSFRRRYAQVEVTLDFFGDAVNSRTSSSLRAALQALDQLAQQSMLPVLQPLSLPIPPVLTYIDKGMGASIIRAGVRLWSPGTINPVAAIKIVRHNVYRPTSMYHEVGHQIAHLTNWGPALTAAFEQLLRDDAELRAMWLPWVSEIVADIFAFVHTGFASVAALYDVVGDSSTILNWPVGDPHPVGWVRTLLGCALSRAAFGASGPWADLERSVIAAHPLGNAERRTAELLLRSRARLDEIAKTCLMTTVAGLGNRPIVSFVDPQRVSPASLAELERDAGASLWFSPHWRRSEGARIVALAGLREAERPERASEWIERARSWLVGTAQAA